MSNFGSKNYFFEVAQLNVTGQEIVTISSRNSDIGTATEEVWEGPADLVYPTAGETWEIVSDNAADAFPSGTGARTVRVPFLDDNYNIVTETLEMNGVTPVTFTSTAAFRPLGGTSSTLLGSGVKVVTAGSNNANVGNIDIRVSGGGNVRCNILAGESVSRQSHFTVPAGKSAYVIWAISPIRKNKDITLSLNNTEGDDGIFVGRFPIENYQSVITISPTAPVGPFLEKTDFKLTGISLNPSTIVPFIYQLILVDN